MSAGGSSAIAVLAALGGNLLIAILKLIAGFVSGSAAMFAESAHSFSDVGNQVLLLIGIRKANAPPSERHPFGTGKSAYFWPMLVAVILFGVAGGYSAFEGIEKFQHPHEVGDIGLALAVLGVSFLIEIVSIAIAFREAIKSARAAGIASVREFLSENRDAALLTVLVEDGLALAGLPIAALALVLAKATGNPLWDAAGSIVIGLMLMGFAVFLGMEIHDLLLGRGLTRRERETVLAVLKAEPTIERVLLVQGIYLGPDSVLLGAEVDMRDDLRADEVETTLARVEEALVKALPRLKYVFLQPRGPVTAPGTPAETPGG